MLNPRRELAALATLVGATLLCATLAGADAPRPVPSAVHRTIEAALGKGARIAPDGAAFEAISKTPIELVVSASGAIEATEVEIPIASVPPAVIRGALAGEPKTAVVTQAEVVVTATGVVFELEVRLAPGQHAELLVDTSGKVVRRELERRGGAP